MILCNILAAVCDDNEDQPAVCTATDVTIPNEAAAVDNITPLEEPQSKVMNFVRMH